MDVKKRELKRKISASSKREPAQLVIKNGKIVDVFNLEIIEQDIAITDGAIVGIGDYEGEQIIDAKGQYVCPGFIDGHVHIESAMVTPEEFAKVVLPHGVTTIIADPHEIANVSGLAGIQYMIDASENLPLNIYYMLPSCVPATPFENAGAVLTAEDLQSLYDHPKVLGLGEVMDYPAVHNGNEEMLNKILDAKKRARPVDGHAAGVNKDGINVYMTAGIRNDHECVTPSEAKERLQRGMYVMLREGSAAKDLEALLEAVTEKNARRCLFVTDDKHLDDLILEGSIDHNIRLTINKGFDPLLAIQIATLNAAECFGLTTKGAIAPGYDADFLLLSDIEEMKVNQVYTAGELVAEKGKVITEITPTRPFTHLTDSIKIDPISEQDLQIKLDSSTANIIEIIPNSLVTKHVIETVDVDNYSFIPSVQKDQLKLAVIERHRHTGNIGLGIVKGLSLQSGAIASTVAHDSHNIVVAGTNDADMVTAVHEMKKRKGGLIVVENGKVMAALSLPIAGLISTQDFTTIDKDLKALNQSLRQIGFSKSFNPFLTLSFLALPVIPVLKLTDLGLFDVKQFKHISISPL
ncbi:adenine deaminase [Evansella vedderi]|uniref:Adenine deaminase n=1 Tax=Evansella vedderi TaxID=38282 RepID=A0ABT9ZNS4_9BACI|nr:adenine deaminase [Evansella vedderi]MDQ0252888.1 adenine deaminase [Evansella vedderi]